MQIRVRVEGVPEAIRRLDGVTSERALRDGLAAAAFLVEGSAKIKAPIDTGFLRNSIWSAVQGRSTYAQRYAEAKSANPRAEMLPEEVPGRLEAIIVASAEYALAIETLATRTRTGSQPFMRPALENNRERIVEIVRNALQGRR